MRNEVNANQLRRWVSLHGLQDGAAAARLLPVTIATPGVTSAASGRAKGGPVEIEAAGMAVRLRDDVTAATLRMVLDVVRGMTP